MKIIISEIKDPLPRDIIVRLDEFKIALPKLISIKSILGIVLKYMKNGKKD